jgi:hypothetical protein
LSVSEALFDRLKVNVVMSDQTAVTHGLDTLNWILLSPLSYYVADRTTQGDEENTEQLE